MIEKIKKLLQLADISKNTNLEEAAAAAAKAQKLMEKHRIHKAMLDEDFSIATHFLIDSGKPENWKVFLASTLSKHNGCYVIKSDNYATDNKIAIVGSAEDTKTIQYLYTYIATELVKLCFEEIIRIKSSININPSSSYTDSFYNGAISVIDIRLGHATLEVRNQELKKAFLPEEKEEIVNALAKIDTRIDKVRDWVKINLHAEIQNVPVNSNNVQGFKAGRQAAEQLDLTPNSRKLGQNDKKI